MAEDAFKPNYSFSNLSVNYLNWNNQTQKSSSHEEFAYLELEAGAGYNWGELYMFFDMENPTKSYSEEPAGNMRFAFKPVIDIRLSGNLFLHLQDYNLKSKDYYISNAVVGLSYKIQTDFGLWIKPFIGPHYQTSTYYSGFNGVMAGWVFDYRFELLHHKLSIAQWHECTVARDDEDGYDEHIGRQGALSLWWHPAEAITTGLQYRYSSYELGESKFLSGVIYSLKYNF